MVYVQLACLALIGFLCEASGGQCARASPAPQAPRRARPGPGCAPAPRPPHPPRLVPQPPPPPCPPNLNAAYRYESNLEEIISKLVNALIYTTLQNNNGGRIGGCSGGGAGAGSGNTGTGSGGGGGSGAGGLDNLLDSLISLDVGVGEADLVNVDVLGAGGGGRGNSGGGGGGTSTLSDLNNQQLLNLILLGGNEGASGRSVGSRDNLLNVGAKLGGKNLANVDIL